MLNFVTGTPGAGKTQFVIDYVANEPAFKGRPVFYWGIPDVADSLGWHRIGEDTFDKAAAQRWHELVEDGAVIIVDESHQVWPKLKQGTKVPDWYEPLGTTRHKGYTIFAITQYPTHVATEYRGRVERHYHLERRRGWERAILLEWDRAAYPLDKDERRQAVSKRQYKFKPDIWKLYKSATVHNVEKKALPKKIWLLPIAVCLGIFAVVGLFTNVSDMSRPNEPAQGGGSLFGGPDPDPAKTTSPESLGAYITLSAPRIEGQDWTAPKYDEVRKVQSYPRPQCIMTTDPEGESRCWCYTQQASRMNVPEAFCRGIVQLGYFDPSVADEELDQPSNPFIPVIDPGPRGPTFTVAQYSGHDYSRRLDQRAAEESIEAIRNR